MLHLYSGYAILLQHFRRYLYGSYLLCDPESDDWKSKRKEDQSSDVHSCRIIYTEIHLHLIFIIYDFIIIHAGPAHTGPAFFIFIL